MNFLYTRVISVALAVASAAHAQTTTTIPVPAQFSTAQTAFLAAASAPVLGDKVQLGNAMIYESMYRALFAMNRYRLAATPAEAELSMEVSIVAAGAAPSTASLRLAIFDTKTHALLWTLDEPVDGAFREKTFQKNVDGAAAKIINDLKALAGSTVPSSAASATTKSSASQEK